MNDVANQIKAAVDSGNPRYFPDCPKEFLRTGGEMTRDIAGTQVVDLLAEAFCDSPESPVVDRDDLEAQVVILVQGLVFNFDCYSDQSFEALFKLAWLVAHQNPTFHGNKIEAAWEWAQYLKEQPSV